MRSRLGPRSGFGRECLRGMGVIALLAASGCGGSSATSASPSLLCPPVLTTLAFELSSEWIERRQRQSADYRRFVEFDEHVVSNTAVGSGDHVDDDGCTSEPSTRPEYASRVGGNRKGLQYPRRSRRRLRTQSLTPITRNVRQSPRRYSRLSDLRAERMTGARHCMIAMTPGRERCPVIVLLTRIRPMNVR